jgi:hypothetical protein
MFRLLSVANIFYIDPHKTLSYHKTVITIVVAHPAIGQTPQFLFFAAAP